MFIGQVQSVTIQYRYKASIGIDLSKVQMQVRGKTITLTIPPLEILSDSITPEQVEKDDFWYPLTEERRKKLLDDELDKCRQRCLNEYISDDETWNKTFAALDDTIASWIGASSSGVTVRYVQAD